MSSHTYPARALRADYLRSAVGLAVTAGPALFLDPAPAIVAILTALAALFGIFGLRTALRQATVVEASGEAIESRGPMGRKLAWHDVHSVKLDFFAMRRSSAEGWMQMKIVGRTGRILVDSSIEGFPILAGAVAAAAASAPIAMNDSTLGNFRALGIELPTRSADEEAA